MKKEEAGCALRSGRRKASVSFSDSSRPPPFLLFLPPTIKTYRFIKSDVYRKTIKLKNIYMDNQQVCFFMSSEEMFSCF
ncbi:hypothetical protein P9597_02800 [Aneurinibacillus migulanus]|uniref:hypothetical protein n=1 Tax=Aneurinibacillus migulanus TaxID=47500 RepID=UPI002E250331|nr:hypothetical protein [Aneurinibacillus migulanus]